MSRDSVTYRKSKAFASRIVKMYSYLRSKKHEDVLSQQVLRSGTSIGANIAEALCAISKPEFINKVSIAHKEAHETLYWLELLGENGFLTGKDCDSISQDCNELISMLVTTLKTSRRNISKEQKP